MKTALLTCLLLLTALGGRGQPTEWFPVGATWSCIVGNITTYENPYRYLCEKDTVIQGKLSKKIVIENNPSIKFFFHQKDDSIYIFLDDIFLEYYNFSAQVGDSMNTVYLVDGWHEVMRVRVDSLGTVDIGSESLRFMIVSNSSRGKLTILEKVGYINLDVNFPSEHEMYGFSNFGSSDLTPLTTILLCYNDLETNVRFVTCEDRCSGEYLVSREFIRTAESNIKVTNSQNKITITSDDLLVSTDIIDLKGGLKRYNFSSKTREEKIYIDEIPNGIYILIVHNKKGTTRKKINILR